jgi:hypothetical protein
MINYVKKIMINFLYKSMYLLLTTGDNGGIPGIMALSLIITVILKPQAAVHQQLNVYLPSMPLIHCLPATNTFLLELSMFFSTNQGCFSNVIFLLIANLTKKHILTTGKLRFYSSNQHMTLTVTNWPYGYSIIITPSKL